MHKNSEPVHHAYQSTGSQELKLVQEAKGGQTMILVTFLIDDIVYLLSTRGNNHLTAAKFKLKR